MATKAFLLLIAFLSCSVLAASSSLGHSRSLLQAAAPALPTPPAGAAPATPAAGAAPATPAAGEAPPTPPTGAAPATPAAGATPAPPATGAAPTPPVTPIAGEPPATPPTVATPATPATGAAPAAPSAGASPDTAPADADPDTAPADADPDPASADADPDAPPAGAPTAPTGTPDGSGHTVFDVIAFGAKADNKTDNVMAFMHAWIAACKNSTTPSKVLIPPGVFVSGPTVFAGPCTSPKPVTVEVLGTIVATVDPSEYVSPEWFTFERVDGLVITGNGTFDGLGAVFWEYNDCKGKSTECVSLPSSLKFNFANNVIVNGISSINSKQFHFHLHECHNFTASHLTITAPGNSPNTDGMHIGDSTQVTVSHSVIGTGDDCISIGEGSSNVTIFNITCGPGHGISVGSLGKRPDDKSVSGVSVTNCTFRGTTNGARIKTMVGKAPGEAKSILYQDLVMENVSNPVVIDQSYGSAKVRFQSNSLWKISDVHFKNIKGSTPTNSGISLDCSMKNPCEAVEVADVDLTFIPTRRNTSFFSSCANAKATFAGTVNPPACSA